MDKPTAVYGRFCSCEPERIRYYGKTVADVATYLRGIDKRSLKEDRPALSAWIKKHQSLGHTLGYMIMEIVPTGGDWVAAEKWWISRLPAEDRLNISDGGDGTSHRGWQHSLETRAKISASHMGIRHTEEAKAKMSRQRKGRTFSDEVRSNMSKAHIGLRHSEESKAKMSIIQKQIPRGPASAEPVRKCRRHVLD